VITVAGAIGFTLHSFGELRVTAPPASSDAAAILAPTIAPATPHATTAPPSAPAARPGVVVFYPKGPIRTTYRNEPTTSRGGPTPQPPAAPASATPTTPATTVLPAPSPPTVVVEGPVAPAPPVPAPTVPAAQTAAGSQVQASPQPTLPTAPGNAILVPSSIPSDCSMPVESQIMQWLATVPDGSSVAFRPGGCYGEDQSITLHDRNGLTIDGQGATFRALTLSEGNPDRANWMLLGGTNNTLENMTIRGANNPSFPTPTRDEEWQHGIDLGGTQGTVIENLSIYDVLGDFIAINSDPDKSYADGAARNITITNVHMDHSGRQGVSLTNTDGFTMTGSYIGNTYNAGVDLEPDTLPEVVENILISGNTFGRIQFAVVSMGGYLTPQTANNITISNNTMAAGVATCDAPLWVGPQPGGGVSNYTATGNRFNSISTMADVFDLNGGTFSNNTVSFYGTGCDGKGTWGVRLYGSSNIAVANNAFIGATGPVSADAGSTNISISGNTQ